MRGRLHAYESGDHLCRVNLTAPVRKKRFTVFRYETNRVALDFRRQFAQNLGRVSESDRDCVAQVVWVEALTENEFYARAVGDVYACELASGDPNDSASHTGRARA
jgi:hypothetical protein